MCLRSKDTFTVREWITSVHWWPAVLRGSWSLFFCALSVLVIGLLLKVLHILVVLMLPPNVYLGLKGIDEPIILSKCTALLCRGGQAFRVRHRLFRARTYFVFIFNLFFYFLVLRVAVRSHLPPISTAERSRASLLVRDVPADAARFKGPSALAFKSPIEMACTSAPLWGGGVKKAHVKI